jgi:hypothetical protein
MSAGRAPRHEDPAVPPRTLKPGGGGGTSDGMDARVARLEAHVEVLRADVADIRTRLAALAEQVAILTERVAVLTERVAHLPGKGFVVSSNVTAIALLSGAIIFAEKLRALMGM